MALEQILCALYVALCEASGGQAAREVADRVLRSAIRDRSINDEAAIEFLQSLCTDQDDEEPSSLH
jgi:dsRNA-specific ribonuclease